MPLTEAQRELAGKIGDLLHENKLCPCEQNMADLSVALRALADEVDDMAKFAALFGGPTGPVN